MRQAVHLPNGTVVVPNERAELRRKVFRRRWLARMAAKAGHYFWMPCPRCGEEFSGREWGLWGYSSLPADRDGRSQGICLPCAVETREAYIRLLDEPTSALSRRGDASASPNASTAP